MAYWDGSIQIPHHGPGTRLPEVTNMSQQPIGQTWALRATRAIVASRQLLSLRYDGDLLIPIAQNEVVSSDATRLPR